jgi:hypothetical protein
VRAAASCSCSPMPTRASIRAGRARDPYARVLRHARRSCTSFRCSCSRTTPRSRAAPMSTSRGTSPRRDGGVRLQGLQQRAQACAA